MQATEMNLSQEQVGLLLDLMHYAFSDIRMFASQGNAEQASDLADAFHNLPKEMMKETVRLEDFRDMYLKPYHEKYPDSKTFNYIARVNEILERGNISGN